MMTSIVAGVILGERIWVGKILTYDSVQALCGCELNGIRTYYCAAPPDKCLLAEGE